MEAFASFVDVIRLGFGDAFQLPFAPKVGFEFGEDSKHIKEALTGGGLVSIGCSVVRKCAPLAFSSRNARQIS